VKKGQGGRKKYVIKPYITIAKKMRKQMTMNCACSDHMKIENI
jgi:hypothetical protein